MLTWVDIIKLCVPFLFALALMWIREWFIARRELRAKHEAFWRLIVQDYGNLEDAITLLDQMASAYKDGKLTEVHEFTLPPTAINFANRLMELDPQHGYIYGDYAAQGEIVNKGMVNLSSLSKDLIKTTDDSIRNTLAMVAEHQVRALRANMITLAEEEVRILKRIKQSLKKDPQEIERYERLINRIKERKERQRGPKPS
jgi:hypothetical protein